MTARQYALWQEWVEGEWERPSRTDHYIARAAYEVRAAAAKDPSSLQPAMFHPQFERRAAEAPKKARPSPQERRRHLANVKGVALARVTGGDARVKPTHEVITREEFRRRHGFDPSEM